MWNTPFHLLSQLFGLFDLLSPGYRHGLRQLGLDIFPLGSRILTLHFLQLALHLTIHSICDLSLLYLGGRNTQ